MCSLLKIPLSPSNYPNVFFESVSPHSRSQARCRSSSKNFAFSLDNLNRNLKFEPSYTSSSKPTPKPAEKVLLEQEKKKVSVSFHNNGRWKRASYHSTLHDCSRIQLKSVIKNRVENTKWRHLDSAQKTLQWSGD